MKIHSRNGSGSMTWAEETSDKSLLEYAQNAGDVYGSIRLVITHRASLTTPTGAVARMHTTHAQKLETKYQLMQMKSWQVIFFINLLGMQIMHSCQCADRRG